MADEINDILPFAPEGDEALGDLEPLATYQEHPVRRRGHQPGIALRAIENRALRQALHMAAGLARWIAGRHAPGVRDDGDLDAVVAGLAAASASGQVPSDRTIAAGTGLSGGGTLAADRSLSFDTVWGDGRYALASRTLTAGDGLSGGGNLTANRSLAVDGSVVRTGRTIAAGDGLSGGGTLAADRALAVDSSVVRTARTITAGTGLSGGGNLSANRTLSFDATWGDGRYALASRTIAAGDGLSGGGSLAADRALAVDGSVMRRNALNEVGVSNFAHRSIQTGWMRMSGGNAIGQGGEVILYGPEHPSFPAEARLTGDLVRLTANSQSVTWDGTVLTVPGTVHVDGGAVVPSARAVSAGDGLTGGGTLAADRALAVDGSVMRRNASNEISFGNFAHRNGQTSYLRLSGGNAIGEGGELLLYGPEHASSPGQARLTANGAHLIWDGATPTAGGSPLAAFSTTAAAGTTSFPIGHIVLVEADALAARNGSVTVRLHSSDTGRYAHTGAGAALAGTGRARGYSVGSGAVIGLAQRVA
ncbi:MAG: hypothetical protein LAT81_16140 [Oceanicaulis sp.]|nr:hypothetical protein [Oceanicaulis sp.]